MNSPAEFRFLLALAVGIAAGFFAHGIFPYGAFFLGGAAVGIVVTLWLLNWLGKRKNRT